MSIPDLEPKILPGGKSYTRQFRLTLDLGHLNPVAQLVIDSISAKTIKVFHPDGTDSHKSLVSNSSGEWDVEAGLSLEVSIMEWLPVVCQHITWESFSGSTIGRYQHNTLESILNVDSLAPRPGPGAYSATIGVSQKFWKDPKGIHMVLAHELAHAINWMTLVVPAFLDWSAFHENYSDTTGDMFGDWLLTLNRFQEQYGTELEYSFICRYWPEDTVQLWWKELLDWPPAQYRPEDH